MELQHESHESERLAAKAHNTFANLYVARNVTLILEIGFSCLMLYIYKRATTWHRNAAREHKLKAETMKAETMKGISN